MFKNNYHKVIQTFKLSVLLWYKFISLIINNNAIPLFTKYKIYHEDLTYEIAFVLFRILKFIFYKHCTYTIMYIIF